MPALFESTSINGMRLKNRFVRSATYEAMAGFDGKVTDQLLELMAELSRQDLGLIITGHAYVIREGQAGPRQMGIYSDEMIEGLQGLTQTVHDHGGVVAVQLAHAGNRGIGKGKFSPWGPSDSAQAGAEKVTAMGSKEIERTVRAFSDAAARAVEAGFDAIQLHAAHSYLLSQFLSPQYNKRKDEYGGSLANRARLLLDVYGAIRERVGTSFPVMIKINSEDFLENGMSLDEMIRVSLMLEERGINAIEMSGGTFESGKNTPSRLGTAKSKDREVYYKEAAKAFKERVKIPLILVGGFLSFQSAEEVIDASLTDYVALSRPLIREPGLIRRWGAGSHAKALCLSCNRCFLTLTMDESLHCAVDGLVKS